MNIVWRVNKVVIQLWLRNDGDSKKNNKIYYSILNKMVIANENGLQKYSDKILGSVNEECKF